MIVVPILSVPPDENFADLERKILQRELRRYKEFSRTAGNVIECLAKIESIEEKCGVIV